jgi:hypothetical protein
MWDDLSPFLTGAGPTATILDPDGTPNNILDVTLGGSITVEWSFSGAAVGFLAVTDFDVQVFADPVGAGSNVSVGEVSDVGPGPAYSVSLPINLGVGAYRLTTLITSTVAGTGVSLPIAGFVDGPIIQIRPGP